MTTWGEPPEDSRHDREKPASEWQAASLVVAIIYCLVMGLLR